MKIYRKYVFRVLNILCVMLTIVSFMNLRKSIQVERENQNKKGYEVFVSSVVLPSTPRIIKMPKATVKKRKVIQNVDTSTREVFATYTGNISHYASDCRGCTGYTASGYNIQNNIYYQDKEFGTVRIVAGDASIPFGSIVRIQTTSGQTILAIVLDRGGIGFGRKYLFDLLCESEKEAYQLGVLQNASIEVLRTGF